MYNHNATFYYKVKNLKKYDEENKKLYIFPISYGALLNNKVIIARGKNLFRFRRCAWVYYPYLKVLYEKLIFGDIEEYYKEMKEAMTKKIMIIKIKINILRRILIYIKKINLNQHEL